MEIGAIVSANYNNYNELKKFSSKESDEKILKDEILNEEELEKVAGGNKQETYDDVMLIADKLYENGNYDYRIDNGYGHLDELQVKCFKQWKMFGVDCQPYTNYPNEYFYKGKQISRQDALAILKLYDPED